MAATVTNDELSAQARLIWRASFLSSLLRPVPPHPLPLSIVLSLSLARADVSPLFPRGPRLRSSPRPPLDLLPSFSANPSGRTCPSVQSPCPNTGQTRNNRAVSSADINDRGIFHRGTHPCRSLILRVSQARSFHGITATPLRISSLLSANFRCAVCSVNEEFLASRTQPTRGAYSGPTCRFFVYEGTNTRTYTRRDTRLCRCFACLW